MLPTGISESEQFLKGTSQIKILSADDVEGMRIVCKVTKHVSKLSRRCHGRSVPFNDADVVRSWLEKSWTLQP